MLFVLFRNKRKPNTALFKIYRFANCRANCDRLAQKNIWTDKCLGTRRVNYSPTLNLWDINVFLVIRDVHVLTRLDSGRRYSFNYNDDSVVRSLMATSFANT